MKKILCLSLSLVFLAMSLCGCSEKEVHRTDNLSEQQISLEYTVDEVYSSYESASISGYKKICEAVVNGETEVDVDVDRLDEINRLVYTSFPLYPLIDGIAKNESGYGVVIKYKNDTEKHKELVAQFCDRVNEIVSSCKAGATNNTQYLLNVYKYVAGCVGEISNGSYTTYDTIMTSKGNSFTFSGMLEYLLLQQGVAASHIIAKDAADVSWGMSAVEIDDVAYYFDVTSEGLANKGEGLIYFGMTTEDANEKGVQSMIFSNNVEALEIDDDRFSACRLCASYEISGDDLVISTFDGSKKTISLLPPAPDENIQ